IWKFNKKLIDNIYDLIPAVKPQSAMYEQYGLPGLKACKKTIDYAHEKGLIVIADIKRGDIGSTSEAYASGHLGKVQVGGSEFAPFDEDMATVNPYLGSDGVLPFVKVCKENDKGIFVLVKTSNPSSGEFQDRLIDGKPLYEHVAAKVEEWGSDSLEGSYSNVGAVVGATYPEQGEQLRKLMPHTFILVPGYGAQGASGKDLKGFFDDNKSGAIVNSSRGIIAAHTKEPYKEKFGEKDFADAARAAVLDMIKDINEAIGR
ncbi:MAG: orotidine-5'-phosphate decarboxylase, partial [Lachnospiraceae bacterium]|nr:orotidine-5'-phosphate decarboxylase [Lachnospiraceae bacterium]